jgi:hypothetical protein
MKRKDLFWPMVSEASVPLITWPSCLGKHSVSWQELMVEKACSSHGG